MELELFRSLVTRIEREINKATQEITGEIETVEIPIGDAIYEVTVIDGLDDTTWNFDNIFRVHFPNVQRCAYVITLFSFLENSLVELCDLFHDEMELNIEYGDMTGRGINRHKHYLTKVIGLDFSQIQREWGAIDNLRKIRNIIVHRDRTVGQNDSAMLEYIRRNDYLDVDPRIYELEVRENFLMNMLLEMEQFVNAVDRIIRTLPAYSDQPQ